MPGMKGISPVLEREIMFYGAGINSIQKRICKHGFVVVTVVDNKGGIMGSVVYER